MTPDLRSWDFQAVMLGFLQFLTKVERFVISPLEGEFCRVYYFLSINF
jgi:hypothetical protein